MKFKIPDKIQIAGRTIKIEFDKKLLSESDCYGESSVTESKITLCNDKRISEETINVTFIHEVFHLILYAMGEEKEFVNEKFVSKISEMLYQFIKQLSENKKS